MADSEHSVGVGAHPRRSETLLLLSQPADEGAAAYCRDHLAPGYDPTSTPIVVLSDPATVEEPLERDYGGRPGVIVTVGDSTRSAAAPTSAPVDPRSPPETVLVTGDLGEVGRAVDEYLTTWSTSGRRTVVCVDSLSGLVEYGSVESVYRFLYVLHRRVGEVGGAAHAHADPRDHEEEILRTYFSLFDRVVSFQDGGVPG